MKSTSFFLSDIIAIKKLTLKCITFESLIIYFTDCLLTLDHKMYAK